MNQSKKLELSKETLRCLDDQDLTDVAGGGNRGGGGNNNSFICVSANQGNSCVCGQSILCDVL
jgi:natural product precursor